MNFIMPEEDIFNPHKDRRFPLPIFYWLAKKTRFSGMEASDKYEFFMPLYYIILGFDEIDE